MRKPKDFTKSIRCKGTAIPRDSCVKESSMDIEEPRHEKDEQVSPLIGTLGAVFLALLCFLSLWFTLSQGVLNQKLR
jgi:hypothetical protein